MKALQDFQQGLHSFISQKIPHPSRTLKMLSALQPSAKQSFITENLKVLFI